ncbi:hypothetical protein M3Y99_01856000 [Aphelenchoides fujianensis]|nr:hypothetical protein M3Y99_01856000 [Aphelenchoides fujianensis]
MTPSHRPYFSPPIEVMPKQRTPMRQMTPLLLQSPPPPTDPIVRVPGPDPREDINDAWKDLEDSEVGFEAWLLSEMMRLQRLDQLVEKFNRKCALHDEWANGKDRMLTSNGLQSELGSHQERAEQIVAIAKGTRPVFDTRGMDEINKKSLSVCTQWERLGKLAAARKEKLEQMEAIAAELDQLQLQFAKAATPFNNWIDSVREDLTDLVIVSEMGEIETLKEEHEKFKATLPAAEKTLREIQNIEQKIQRLIQTHDLDPDLLRNPYADLSLSTLNAHWNGLLEQIPRRDSELELERRRQEQNEKLRREFGERANAIGPSLERRLERVLAVGASGSLEEGIQELERIQQEVRGEKSKLDELERINQQMQENFVFEAIGSRYSMESLRVGYETLMTAIHRVINELRNQQLLRDAKGDAKEDDPKLQQLVAQLDANKTGRVHLNALLDFLTREHADSDHVDQMEAAFRLLANGKPTISAETIRQEMAPAQAAECLRSMAAFRDANSGEFDYAAFCRSLFLSLIPRNKAID